MRMRILLSNVFETELLAAAIVQSHFPGSIVQMWPTGEAPYIDLWEERTLPVFHIGDPPAMSYVAQDAGEDNDFLGTDCFVFEFFQRLKEQGIPVAGIVDFFRPQRFVELCRELAFSPDEMIVTPAPNVPHVDYDGIRTEPAFSLAAEHLQQTLSPQGDVHMARLYGALRGQSAGARLRWLSLALDGVLDYDLEDHESDFVALVEELSKDSSPGPVGQRLCEQARKFESAVAQVTEAAQDFGNGIFVWDPRGVENFPDDDRIFESLIGRGCRISIRRLDKGCGIKQPANKVVDLRTVFTQEESTTPAPSRGGASDSLGMDAELAAQRILAAL